MIDTSIATAGKMLEPSSSSKKITVVASLTSARQMQSRIVTR